MCCVVMSLNSKCLLVCCSFSAGLYTLVPYYRGENTLFDVSPSSVDVRVGHDSVKILEPFQVNWDCDV